MSDTQTTWWWFLLLCCRRASAALLDRGDSFARAGVFPISTLGQKRACTDGQQESRARPRAGYSAAMPVEGQWERQQTPLRHLTRRELRLVQGFLAVLLVAAVAGVALAVSQSAPPVPH